MIRGANRFTHAAWAIGLGSVLIAAPVSAAPGDALGGDDTGCAPSTDLGLKCTRKVAQAIAKLRVAVVKCHLTQAGLAFQTGMGSSGFSNAEENCEIGPSNNSAKNKFDEKIASLAGAGCDATVIANALAARDVILSDDSVVGSMDNLNATFFCDPTSGNEIDPGGDDGGFIPATPENYKCSVVVAKSWYKLQYYLYRCHDKLVKSVFKGTPFDDELCETDPLKGALAKYDKYVNRYVDAGYCPPCLTDPGPTNALDLGANTVAEADANLDDVFICPGP